MRRIIIFVEILVLNKMISKKFIAQQMGEVVSHTISNDATEKLASILIYIELEKNEFLLKEGEISDLVYYVKRGLLRQFCYKNGKELTEHFACEENIFICLDSFFCRKPTHAAIEALEPTALYGIPYEPFMSLVRECGEISLMYCRIMEMMLTGIQKKIFEFQFETANERYQRFLKERPDIIQRVPLLHIASYLLMSPETLSRVRAGILNGSA
ncbi:MAG: Crp/Fnr family transcriptional regulator [Tannerellaceae bacterium]|jgi:CRP-like cAMP-binding protein|nr:Crp/Fnr family transcriptional regulator [Tannerellaceae bacterium]